MSLISLHEYGEKVNHYKPLKPEKILKKVVGQQYTFAESRKDLDLLQSIVEGNYANTKPGDPSFHDYFNHTGNAIFVAGVPDQPGSMPHSEGGRKL